MCIFHKWTKWEDHPVVSWSPLSDLITGQHKENYEIGQKRRCLKCGKEELRTKH